MLTPQKTVVLDGDLSLDLHLDGDASLDMPMDGDVGVQMIATNLRPATTSLLGGIIVGDDLSITPQGRLSVIKANRAEQDNTHPITSAAVYTEIGNIDALLSTI